MSEETLAKIAVGLITLGVWVGMLWVYVSMRRKTALRELLTLRLRACARLQLPLRRLLETAAGAPPEVAGIMREAAENMQQGQPLSEALEGPDAAIPWWYRRMLAVGEESGNLADVFDLLVETDGRGEERRISYFDQLIYPCMLLLFVFTLLEGILIFILPKLTDMFRELGVEQTALQSGILAVADVLVPIMPFILMGMVLVMGSLAPFPGRKRWADYFPPIRWLTYLCRRVVPGVGRAYFRAASARWAGMVSLLLEAGMPLPEALEAAAGIESDPTFRNASERWASGVADGQSLSSVLSQDRFVPRTLLWQVRCAEGGPDLPAVLRDVAEREMSHLRRNVGYVFGLIAPFFVLGIGAIVGLVAVGLFQYMTRIVYTLL